MTASVHRIDQTLSTDPREQPVSATAIDALALPPYVPLTAAQVRHHDVLNGLGNLIAEYGAAHVMRMVRLLAHVNGEEVSDERPADRCLADGGPLSDGVCVRCGRDNR